MSDILRVEGKARHGFAFQIVDDDVIVAWAVNHCQALSVGRKAWISIVAWRANEWLGFAGAIQPYNRVGLLSSLTTAVNQRAGGGKIKLHCGQIVQHG